MLLFVYTTTRKRFVIFTSRYFKLSRNNTALSQSNCRNFSCSSIMWLARTRLLRHAFPISLMILRKKTRLFCSLMSFKTYFYLFYCFLPSVATWDGKYEHGLKLFQVLMLSLQKSSQNLLWFVLLGEVCLISSFLTLQGHSMYG